MKPAFLTPIAVLLCLVTGLWASLSPAADMTIAPPSNQVPPPPSGGPPADGRTAPKAVDDTAAPKGPSGPTGAKADAGLSRIEEFLSGRFPTRIAPELRQFGYDFFDRSVSTFAPVENVPVGDDYIIGPGDKFSIHLWGNAEENFTAEVTRDGRITLPRLGTIVVGGMSIGAMKQFINEQFEKLYPEFQSSFAMDALRTIDVFIVGEVKAPGTYSISSLSTVISALYAAGGPGKNGTLRNIRLMRDGVVVKNLDLYDFLIHGFKGDDIRLQPGDVIFTPVLGPVAGISGNVRRPAIYEMKAAMTIGQLLEVAGGVLPTGQLQNVVVERIEKNQKRVIRSFNLDAADTASAGNLTMPIQDGDLVKIFPVHDLVRQVVYLEGHVKYPVEHELRPGMRLRDIIASYDAFQPEAYLERAEIVRRVPPDWHPRVVHFSPAELLAGNEAQNLLLQDLDRVRIFSAEEKAEAANVVIKGAVRHAGVYRLYPGMTVKDLIFKAGNPLKSAYMGNGSISRIALTGAGNADLVKLSFSPEEALKGIAEHNLDLRPDDEIFIHEIPNYASTLERRVTLRGEVRFPGEYAFAEGERLASVIERAGGITAEAYCYGAAFYRESAKDAMALRLKEYIARLEQELLAAASKMAELESDSKEAQGLTVGVGLRKQLIEKLKSAEPTGRMVINLEEVIMLPSSPHNIELKAGDKLVIGKRPDHVNVIGEVFNPTAVVAESGKNAGYFLTRVGGATKQADESQIHIVRGNGSVVSMKNNGLFGMATWDDGKGRWNMGGFASLEVQAGDTIIVPRETEPYGKWALTKDIVEVLFKAALAAGVVIAAI